MAARVGLAGVSAVQWHWVAGVVVLLLVALWWRSGLARALLSGGVLAYRHGLWVYRASGSVRKLRLQQAWPSALWVTLRFHEASQASPGNFLEITIWKPGLAPRAWQQLCMQVAQDLQFPNGGQLDRT